MSVIAICKYCGLEIVPCSCVPYCMCWHGWRHTDPNERAHNHGPNTTENKELWYKSEFSAMPEALEIKVNEETHRIEAKDLTLICHKEEMQIEAPGRFSLTPEHTVKVANNLDHKTWKEIKKDKTFLKLWPLVFGTEKLPPNIKTDGTLAQKHVTGLILTLIMANTTGLQLLIKMPETYLHPAAQLGLADLFIAMTKGLEE